MALLLVLFSYGQVALSFRQGTGQELLFDGRSGEEYALRSAFEEGDIKKQYYHTTQTQALWDDLSQLQLVQYSGNYDLLRYRDSDLTLVFRGPEGQVSLAVQGDYIHCSESVGSSQGERYWCPEGFDLAYVEGLLSPRDE